MIIGIGLDIVEVKRFAEALERNGERMRMRFFTTAERAYCESHRDPAPHYAARFAAKEAFAKALGRGIANGIRWVHVEVIREPSGKPSLQVHAIARTFLEERGNVMCWLSLSHTDVTAAATVVLELIP